MKRQARKSERGIAMLVVLFALVLVSVIGLALMFSTNAETGVNSGFRQTNLAYFAARSGAEEARDRIRPTGDLFAWLPKVPIGSPPPLLPAPPANQIPGVVYITNLDATETTKQMYPWKLQDTSNVDNPYFDDELCHETADTTAIAGAPGDPSKPCARAAASLPPTAVNWYKQQLAENLPGSATISYKWVRINLKMNESSSPWCVLGVGNCGIVGGLGASAAHDQVCYNGKNEFVITKANEPLDVPGRVEGVDLPSQLAMAMGMFEGGSAGHGTGGHASSTSTGTSTTGTSSASSTTTGTSTTGISTTGTSTSTSSSSTSSTSSTSSSTSSSSSSTTSSTSSSSTTGFVGTASSSSSSSTTGFIGTASTSSTTGIGLTSTSSSSSGSSSTSSSSSSSSGTTTGGTTPPPAGSCAQHALPLPGTPVGIGNTPVPATSCQQVEAQPVYMLTSLAVAPNSSTVIKARRMIQYEVARIALPPVPSALLLAGPHPNLSVPNSGNYGIHGIDDDTACPTGNQDKPAIGLVGDSTLNTSGNPNAATTQAGSSRDDMITALTTNGVKTQNYDGVDGCTPDAQNVQNTTNPLYTTPTGLNEIVRNVMNSGTLTYPSGTSLNDAVLGTATNPETTVVQGDLTVSGNSNGYGILLVTGTLTFKGTFNYHGVILVIGNGVIQQGGGGSGNFDGAIIVANIAGNSSYATNPVEANLAANLGPATWDWSGGGGNGLQYNSCAIDIGMKSASYTVIARREITY